jgi:UDP-2-acetamido-3-amino-2,3-dideoxy-glucuronate N-acetyltransferase
MPGAFIDDSAIISDDVYIGPNAVVLSSSDMATQIEAGAEIGANATIYAGVTIGTRARILPGAVIARSVPPFAIVDGNPARITGYVNSLGRAQTPVAAIETSGPQVSASSVKGVTKHRLRFVPDIRGSLTVGEFERDIPFRPLRYFVVFDVPSTETRGEHAHLRCHQFLVAVRGSVSLVADDGTNREEFLLNSPLFGVYLPPMTWGIQYRYSADAVLFAFASDHYDSADYIRNYPDFLRLIESQK